MKKILTIAIREYKAMVGTKAFLASIVMMPILMLGGLVAIQLLNKVGEVKERRIAIADGTGELTEVIQRAAESRNAAIDSALNDQENASMAGRDRGGPSLNRGEKFYFEVVDQELDEEKRISLSERISNQELYGLLEIPANALDPLAAAPQDSPTNSDQATNSPLDAIRFYSQDSGLSPARGWLQSIISEHAKALRLRQAKVDPIIVAQASVPIEVKGMGLVRRASDGTVVAAEEKDVMSALFLPMGVMMLMFMVIFMASQPMLESVLEEKSQRIAEVLLGSANPFQIMSGKLIGSVAGSITIFSIYLVGIYFLAQQRGMLDAFPMHLVPWFIVFQILGVLFYAAIFLAVGASVTQLKEAQSILLPVWMLLMSPMFIWIFIVQDPNGSVAKWFSLFPPATPTTMMLRLSTGQTIPWWQPATGVVLTTLATLAIVVIAGRIFRIGILWQGKTPKLSEILRWGISG